MLSESSFRWLANFYRHRTKTSSLLLRLPSATSFFRKVPAAQHCPSSGRWATSPALPPSPKGHQLPRQEFLPGLLSRLLAICILNLHCYHSMQMIPKMKSECPCTHISHARQDTHTPVTLPYICANWVPAPCQESCLSFIASACFCPNIQARAPQPTG